MDKAQTHVLALLRTASNVHLVCGQDRYELKLAERSSCELENFEEEVRR